MSIAIAFVLIAIASVLFHFLSPWWFTPAASNWGSIDTTVNITMIITGVVFVLINLFIAYSVVRFRYRKGRRSNFEPENKKLERWLIGLTSLGILAMLAPGLFVYSEFVNPPKTASVFEVLGQQWKWSFRFPGKDGELGKTSPRHINSENPFGLNLDDPDGQDDILINSSELHLPVNKPFIVTLRSTDVLHDFYVPQLRAKMDLVPGMVTSFWFTPTKIGKYEILCAELCGVGHFTMRGLIRVEPDADFQTWLAAQPTFAQTIKEANQSKSGMPAKDIVLSKEALIEQGFKLAQMKGCRSCHSVDGSRSIGPGWKDLYGKKETLVDGLWVVVDDDYLKESILQPNTKIVEGYAPIMPALSFSDQELNSLIAYIKAQSTIVQKDKTKTEPVEQEG